MTQPAQSRESHRPFARSPNARVWRSVLVVLLLAGLLAAAAQAVCRAEEPAAVEKRLADSIRYLASDELEGRGLGTKGIDLAADYLAAQFAQAGLKTDLFDGSPFQRFQAPTTTKLGPTNTLALVGPPAKEGEEPQRAELKLGEDFSPMTMSGSAKFDLPVVFAGYGITAPAEGYDDYAGIDAKGKAVLILRHEPQQADPKSVFAGTKDSAYATYRAKVSNAFQHGAAAVLVCTDEYEIHTRVQAVHKRWQAGLQKLADEYAALKQVQEPTLEQIEAQRKRIEELTGEVESLGKLMQSQYDPLIPFGITDPEAQDRDFPVIFCRRAAVDRMVRAALGTDLAALERQIDEGPKTASRSLEGWRAAGEVKVTRAAVEAKNVVALLPGKGPGADEALVIGAHYDHLGMGGRGSLSPGEKVVHNGADDNASGAAALPEIARALAAWPEPLHRTVVFVAFTGEESGLLGSGYYVGHPVVPLDKTIAMLNLDMVGRLRDDKLTVFGSSTGAGFDDLLEHANKDQGFQLNRVPGGVGPSDQLMFAVRQVPVMHFFTGLEEDYHRPSDDFEKINVPGERRVVALASAIAAALANAQERPKYVAVASPRMVMGSDGQRPFFGSVPQFGRSEPGYAISGTTPGGPAEKAGLKAGDLIVALDDAKIANLDDFDAALRKHKGGDRVRVVVRRGQEELTVEATLEPPR